MSADLPYLAELALKVNTGEIFAGLFAFVAPQSVVWTTVFGEHAGTAPMYFWCMSICALGIICHISRILSIKLKHPLVAAPALIGMMCYHISFLVYASFSIYQDPSILNHLRNINMEEVYASNYDTLKPATAGISAVGTIIAHSILSTITAFGIYSILKVKLTQVPPTRKANVKEKKDQ